MRKKPGVWEGVDDGRRPSQGLLISVVDLQPGYVRVIFDVVDLIRRRPATWRQSTFVTFSNVSSGSLKRLSNKRATGLGLTVLGILGSTYPGKNDGPSRKRRASRA